MIQFEFELVTCEGPSWKTLYHSWGLAQVAATLCRDSVLPDIQNVEPVHKAAFSQQVLLDQVFSLVRLFPSPVGHGALQRAAESRCGPCLLPAAHSGRKPQKDANNSSGSQLIECPAVYLVHTDPTFVLFLLMFQVDPVVA